MESTWPRFKLSKRELEAGRLAYVGTFTFRGSGRVETRHVVLSYPDATPYAPPQLTPVRSVPLGDDWTLKDVTTEGNVYRLSHPHRRHQMSGGSICLFEADDLQSERISGSDLLRRGKAVLQAEALNLPRPYPDSQEADLESHFRLSNEDVILPTPFFDERLKGKSGFFQVVSYFDWSELFALDEFGSSRSLWIGTNASTASASGLAVGWSSARFGQVIRSFPQVFGLRSFLRGELERSELNAGGGIARPDRVIEGRWFELDEEPPPMRCGKDVREVLGANGVKDPLCILEYAISIHGRGKHSVEGLSILGLRFPHRSGEGYDWLILAISQVELLKTREAKDAIREHGKDALRSFFDEAPVSALRVHRLDPHRLLLRNQGRVPQSLETKRVMIFGCGALGADVAVTLAKAGVGHLELVDFDVLKVQNVIRHAAPMNSVGYPKPHALKLLIWQHNPYTDVTCHTRSIFAVNELEEKLQGVDLVVSTMAVDGAEDFLNHWAVESGATVIYARALRGGDVARVFRVRPTLDACKECLSRYHRGGDLIDVPPAEDELLLHECGHAVLAGSAADLRFCADFTSRMALDELGTGAAYSMLLWSQSGIPGCASLDQPMSLVRESHEPHPDCSTCGRPHTKTVQVSKDAMASIEGYVEASPDRETGGILIGYRSGSVVVVLRATGPGPRALRSAARFERDAEFCQNELDLAIQADERACYVGEWHSHLEVSPRPSVIDIDSLMGISVAPNYLTTEPIMLIAGTDTTTKQQAGLYVSCFPLGRHWFEPELILLPDDVPN